jgi:hypothetical protein
MIISASYKTDIPAFYGAWFENRLAAGECRMVNPYGGQVHTVSLAAPDVDGFVFWTRNPGPFLGALDTVRLRGFPFIVHTTITGYPQGLDFATIEAARAVAHLDHVRRRFGARAAVWRYDPVVLTSLTPPAWHRANFAALARSLRGIVDEVVVSFVQVYRKTARNMDARARAAKFEWWDPPDDEKRALLGDLAAIAAENGIAPTLCGQPHLAVPAMGEARCIDARRLGDVAGRPIAAPAKPHRKRCGCWASRDIGDYDTCPHGCAYCYAVESRHVAKRRHRAHDPAGEFLMAPPSARAGAA